MTTRDEHGRYISRRGPANDLSRNHAEHYGQPWTVAELEVLMLWQGGDAELAEIAELTGRTIEACRQRFYTARDKELTGPTDHSSPNPQRPATAAVACPRCFLVHQGEC